MSKNNIGYITKKHFRSAASLLVALVSAAIAALSAYIAVLAGYAVAAVAFASFAVISALFVLLRIISPNIGCKLMRISVALTAVALFFSGMSAFTLGYLLFMKNGIQTHLNEALSAYGFSIATPPTVTCWLLFGASFLLYFASACAFFCHRYLGAVRKCSKGDMKRHGLRVFPILSASLFIMTSGCAASLLIASDGITARVMSDPVLTLAAADVLLIIIHPLAAGLCARSFARRTYAFKVFENQIMKVETNADGIIYVPINEDVEPGEPGEEELFAPSKPRKSSDEVSSVKSFISEYSSVSTHETDSISENDDEQNIL